jgi:hypothetical protein
MAFSYTDLKDTDRLKDLLLILVNNYLYRLL